MGGLCSRTLGGHAMFTFDCMAAGFIILSTAAALLLPAGLDVTLSDVAQRLQAETGNHALQTRNE
jgi:hypothetical protein